MSYMSDCKEFQDTESTCSGKLSQSAGSGSKSSSYVEPRPEACDLIRGICLGHRETFLAIHVQYSIHHRHHIKEFFTLGIKVLQVEPVRDSTGRPVAKSAEQFRGTIPLPSFARRPATMASFFPAEGPQESNG